LEQSRHLSLRADPENCAKASRERDSFDGAEGDAAFGGACILCVATLDCQFRLLLYAWEGVHGVEEMSLLTWVFYECVKGVGLGGDILNSNLEAMESSGFRELDLIHEVMSEISMTIPLLAAKHTSTWEMKWRLLLDKVAQSAASPWRSISLAVQKEATTFF
jgi:hypothetical protein